MAFKDTQAKAAIEKLKRSPPSPENEAVRAAARRILDGQGWTQADVNAVARFNGVKRFNAGTIRKAQQAFNNQMELAQRYGTAGAVLSDPTVSASKKIALSAQLAKDMEELLKTKFVRDISKNVAKFLGSNASAAASFMRSLRSGLRIGGAVAMVGMAGAELAEQFFETRRAKAQAQLQTFEMQKRAGIDPSILARVKKDIDVTTEGAAGWWEYGQNKLGFSSSITEKAEKRKQEYIALLTKGRENMGALGMDDNEILAEGAAARGKQLSDLSERERKEILDRAFMDKFDYRKYGASDAVQKKLEAAGYKPGDGGYGSALQQFSMDYVRQLIETQIQRIADIEGEAAKIRSKRSGLETWKANEELRSSAAAFASYRMRQRPYLTN